MDVSVQATLLCLLLSGFILTWPSLDDKGASGLFWITYSNPIYQVYTLDFTVAN